ncbi:IS4 family transposase [Nocardiopsis exhalans]|uniref:IS4 family transposase n=1 Tax=Nocardiopsis exhalans TaxID=163604 RepID=A0ABY5D877_9ACTN|nr:IS4 family transposase [Nocardiopsis exhalans]USY19956.1 IS4 family transposase [Nocardiopsis exhalans]
MPDQYATTSHTHTRTITVAAGIYAPGHLGELTRYLPFDLIDAVLEHTRTQQQRLRALPSRVGVYFVLALNLFPHLGYARVWDTLVAGLQSLPLPRPSQAALVHLRRRLGPTPFKTLFQTLAAPLAQPTTPGTRYRHWRTVAFDACHSIKAPDSARNLTWLRKICYQQGTEGYPRLQITALCETGTRSLLGATLTRAPSGEPDQARTLLDRLTPQMLVLADQAYQGNTFLGEVADTGAQLLIRLREHRRPRVETLLPDGSYLTHLDGLKLRIVQARITATTQDGTQVRGVYRLATTLLDHRTDPARQLLALYHERWEVESAFYSLRHTLLHRRVLRSQDPAGLEQEVWALLVLYQALRMPMVEAVESRPGTHADRAAFTTALNTARCQVITAQQVLPDQDAPGRGGGIVQAVRENLLPARRARISARKLKCSHRRYREADPERPLTTDRVQDLELEILAPAPEAVAGPQQPAAKMVPGIRPGGSKERTMRLLGSDLSRGWSPIEVARALDYPHYRSLATQMGVWVQEGFLQRTAHGRYTLALRWAGVELTAQRVP